MSKTSSNSRINNLSLDGLVITHELDLNQPVRTYSSPTFNSLLLTGNLIVNGDASILGNFTNLDTNLLRFKDNIILINDHETSFGITLNEAGFEIDRGQEENYRFTFQESSKNFRIGPISSMQAVATREDTPLNHGIMTYNSILNRIDSTTTIQLPINFSSTVNSFSTSTGSIITAGGIGIAQNLSVGGYINLSSTNTIFADPSGNINLNTGSYINLNNNTFIPYDKNLYFGSSSQSVSASSLTSDLTLNSFGNIHLTPSFSNAVIIPNGTPLILSTASEKIVSTITNDLIIQASENIYLTAGQTKFVQLPSNVSLNFGNTGQTVSADISNNLTLKSSGNLNLNPLGIVHIASDKQLQFGTVGNQSFTGSDSTQTLTLAGQIINLAATGSVQVASNIPIYLSNDLLQYIKEDGNGNIVFQANYSIKSQSIFYVSSLNNSTSGSSGSIHTDGGLGISKDIFVGGNAKLNNNLNVSNIFDVNNNGVGNVSISAGDGSYQNTGLTITNGNATNAFGLISLVGGTFDTTVGYTIGRGTMSLNSGRTMSINIPSFSSDYNSIGANPSFAITTLNSNVVLFQVSSDSGNGFMKGSLNIYSTSDATNNVSGALQISGGMYVAKSILSNGNFTVNQNSTNALLISNSNGNILNVDTVNDIVTNNASLLITSNSTNAFNIQQNSSSVATFSVNTLSNSTSLNSTFTILNTTDSTSLTSASTTIYGGTSIAKQLLVGGQVTFLNSLNMSGTGITNLKDPINPQDACTKNYADLLIQGLTTKDAVQVSTTQAGILSNDFSAGSTVDGYILQSGDRILIKNQSNAVENGIYIVNSSGSPTRSLDLKIGSHAATTFCFVREGQVNYRLGFICNNTGSDIVGTDPLNYTEFTGAGLITPGLALSTNFNTINVNYDDFSIEINGTNQLQISNKSISTGLTGGSGANLRTSTNQSHVTQLGTITSGTWNANVIATTYGGTGQSSFVSGALIFGNGAFNPLNTSSNLFWNNTLNYLAIGHNSPTSDLHIVNSINDAKIIINSVSGSSLLNFISSSDNSVIGIASTAGSICNGSSTGNLVISHQNNDITSKILFGTTGSVRAIIDNTGNFGINTLNPTFKFQVEGSSFLDGTVSIGSTIDSTSLSLNGGATIAKSLSIGTNLVVHGNNIQIGNTGNSLSTSLNFISNNSTAPNFDFQISVSSGNTSDGNGIVSLNCSELDLYGFNHIYNNFDSTSVTTGSIITEGGIGIRKSASIGGNLNVITAGNYNYLGNVGFVTQTSFNYLTSFDNNRDSNIIQPLHFSSSDKTIIPITLYSGGLIVCNSKVLQIGGTFSIPDGFNAQFNTNTLNIDPINTNYTLAIGQNTTTNFKIYNGSNYLCYTNSNLNLQSSSLSLSDTSGNVSFYNPDSNKNVYFKAITNDYNLNIGGNSSNKLNFTLSSPDNLATWKFNSGINSATITSSSNVNTVLNGSLSVNSLKFNTNGNGVITSIQNTNSASSAWFYLGKINNYLDLTIRDGQSASITDTFALSFQARITSGTCYANHKFESGGNSSIFSDCNVQIFYDNTSNYYAFILAPSSSFVYLDIVSENSIINPINEGIGSNPSGSSSNFLNTWTNIYTTAKPSTRAVDFGNLTSNGNSATFATNLLNIGLNNSSTNSSRDTGIVLQRYQVSNDTGLGSIVNNDSPTLTVILPIQGSSNPPHITLANPANTVANSYNGYWVRLTSGTGINQVRQITSYSGAQVALIDQAWTTNPSAGDSVQLFSHSYSSIVFNETKNAISLDFIAQNPGANSLIMSQGATNLTCGIISSVSSNVSTSNTTGAIQLIGGIGINNTSNSINCSNGGTFTSAGGIAVAKDVYVGGNIGISNLNFTPNANLHIRNTIAKVQIESNYNTDSSIIFANNSSSSVGNSFGLAYKGGTNHLSFVGGFSDTTFNTSSSTEYLTIDNTGNIGINASTNISNLLTLNSNNFIGINTTSGSDSGYLGLTGSGGNGYNRGSRILLSGNNRIGFEGFAEYFAGNGTNSSHHFYTGTDTEQLRINSVGSVVLFNSQGSTSTNTGTLQIAGGITVSSGYNSSSFTNGGSLTVSGGGSFNKDLYVGGNLYLSGAVTSAGTITSPSITATSFTNCNTNVSFSNVSNVVISPQMILSFVVALQPNVSNSYSSIIFGMPNKTTNFATTFDVIFSAMGMFGSNLVAIQNITAGCIVGTTNCFIRFQASSTATHNIMISSTYKSG